MIEYKLDTAHSVLYVRPRSALDQDDFAKLANTVDPYIETNGNLAGLVIDIPAFLGWKNIGAMAAHLRFVRDHHRRLRKVAVLTDSSLGSIAERLASRFVSPEIKRFSAADGEAARQWVLKRQH